MKVLAFSTSNKKSSINKELTKIIGQKLEKEHDVEYLDMTKITLPIYSEDVEEELGVPEDAKTFFEKIKASDILVISLAEHNGNYTAFYKNLFDWASRIEMKVYQDKKVIVTSTSPGQGGATSVLSLFEGSASFFGADIIAKISLPNFYENFNNGKIEDDHFNKELAKINI